MVYVVCVCGLNACAYSVNWVRGHWVGGAGLTGGIVIYSLRTDGNTGNAAFVKEIINSIAPEDGRISPKHVALK